MDESAIERILTDFVDRHDDVVAAVFGSADGHPIASASDGIDVDGATMAAMGAAAVGLAGQLLRFGGDGAADDGDGEGDDRGGGDAHVRGRDTQVWVIDVRGAATLTVVGRTTAPGAVAAGARALADHLATALHE